jgi:hypothetical protein
VRKIEAEHLGGNNPREATPQLQDRTNIKVLWEENHETYYQKIAGYAVAIPISASLAMSAPQANTSCFVASRKFAATWPNIPEDC